jgi:hypothetical protein
MSNNTRSNASSDHSWMKLYAAVAVLPLVLTACGGGGGGGGAPTPPATPTPAPTPTPTPSPSPSAPSLTVTSSDTATFQGGASITLTATVANSTDTPTWTLSGPGSLSASSGTSIQYVPPTSGLAANTTVTISAALTGATTQTVTLTLTVNRLAGMSWTDVTASSIGNLLAVDYADNTFVAISDSGDALASTNAVTWTPVPLFSSNVSTDHFKANAIAHLGSTAVAVGSISPTPYTTSTGTAAYSTNGTTWTMASLPSGSTPLHGLIIGTARIIGLGEGGHVYSTTDGHSWQAVTTITGPQTINAGAFGNGRYIGVGNAGYIVASSDGSAWQAGQVVVVGGTARNMYGVTWTGSQFVAVGDSGTITTSTDGSAWSAPKTSAITGTLRAVSVSSTGEIVVVGDNGIETSEDGNTWTARSTTTAAALNGVAYGNNQFVAVGASSAIKTSSSN